MAVPDLSHALCAIVYCLDVIKKIIAAGEPHTDEKSSPWGKIRKPERVAVVAAEIVPEMRKYFAALERCQTDAREELMKVRRRQVAGGLLAQPSLVTVFGRSEMFALDGAYHQLKTEVQLATLINKMGEIAPGDNAILNAVDKLTPLATWGPVITLVAAEVEHAENVLAQQPGGGGEEVKSEPPLKLPTRPPDKAFQAWQIRELVGISKQQDIADTMTKQGISATQGQVSKWITAVEAWRTAGGLMPEVGTLEGEPQSVDPDILDMGARQDGLTPRQRPRRDSDADE